MIHDKADVEHCCPTKVPIKITIVGDEGVGKSTFGAAFRDGKFNNTVETLVSFEKLIPVDHEIAVKLSFCDIRGNESYERFNHIVYPHTDLFLICFSIVHPDSYDNVISRWIPDVKNWIPDCDIILIGTHEDLRTDAETIKKLSDKGKAPISTQLGEELCKKINAKRYIEVSSKNLKNIIHVFNEGIRLVLAGAAIEQRKTDAGVLPFMPGSLKIHLIKGTDLLIGDINGFSDPFVAVGTYNQPIDKFYVMAKSKVIKKTLNPEWNEEIILHLTDSILKHATGIKFRVWDKDLISDDFLGECIFSWDDLSPVLKGEVVNFTADLTERLNESPVGAKGTITVSFTFTK